MKNIIVAIVCIFLLSFNSCQKEKDQEALVFRNCTGTYVLINNQNYKVCNANFLAKINDNTTLFISYKCIDYCTDDNPECLMLFPFESYINIKDMYQ